MATELTKRQQTVLDIIIECIRSEGRPPTMQEICAELGMTSTNAANDHLAALERKGYIERSSKARGITVTEKGAKDLYRRDSGVLPLLGRVAAGAPVLAEENVEDYVPVSAEMAGRQAYCLRVRGDSMIEDGILDGDIVVVDTERRPRKGDVVVALVEDEATVKHYHPDGKVIELRPANSDMQPMRFPANHVQVQGVVVALQRALN